MPFNRSCVLNRFLHNFVPKQDKNDQGNCLAFISPRYSGALKSVALTHLLTPKGESDLTAVELHDKPNKLGSRTYNPLHLITHCLGGT